METGIKDKVAVVTGAAAGLGKAIALGLAAEGVKVAVCDINENGIKAVAKEITGKGGASLALKADVSKETEVRAMVAEVLEKFAAIDILVNNAGVVGRQGPWAELPEQDFDFVVGVNFKGVYLCCRAVVPHLMKRRSGKIINIASCAAKTGEPYNGVYSATKAAIQNLTQSLARELGPYNINVNAVCPAAMDTDLMEKVYRERSKYFGIQPEELRKKIAASFILPEKLTVHDAASLVVFLASDKAARMTGQAVNITGGIEVH